jgi:hypothetical protein
MGYFQYEKGVIDLERLKSTMAPLALRLHNPKVVAQWKIIKKACVPAYIKYIEVQIENADVLQSNT